MLHATETGNKLRPCGLLARVRLYHFFIAKLVHRFYTVFPCPTQTSIVFARLQ